jgi:hypothetical protein
LHGGHLDQEQHIALQARDVALDLIRGPLGVQAQPIALTRLQGFAAASVEQITHDDRRQRKADDRKDPET